MTQLHPLNIYAVKVPDDAYNFYISGFNYLCSSFAGIGTVICEVPDDYEILGTVKNGVIDFDCEGLVDLHTFNDGNKYFRNYGILNFSFIHVKSKNSFLSLLQANNMDLNCNYVILKER